MIKRRPAILIAEDDATARKKLTRYIEKSGFHALTAENGREALVIFEAQAPEVVLTDLKMPNMDGLDLLEAVKKRNPHTNVIIMSAYGDMDTVIKVMRLGAFDFIEKPLDLSELDQSLKRAYLQIEAEIYSYTRPGLLIIEDNPKISERLSAIIKLEKPGWRIYTASTQVAGRRLYSAEKIDIIIVDICLPDGDGIELIDELAEEKCDFETLILTGFGDENNAMRALKAGVFDFFPKPPPVDEMLVSIEKALIHLTNRRAAEYKKLTGRKE